MLLLEDSAYLENIKSKLAQGWFNKFEMMNIFDHMRYLSKEVQKDLI